MRTSMLRGVSTATVLAMLSTSLSAFAQDAPPPAYGGAVTVEPVPLGPKVIKNYDEGDPVPAGYHPETRARLGLVIGGSVTFGVFYMMSVLVAGIGTLVGSSDTGTLYLPAVGPFLTMGNTTSGEVKTLLAVDGIVQTAGVVMLVAGIAAPKTVLVRNDLSARVIPMTMGKEGYGLGVAGTF
jgi:hypothetical protein